MVQVQMLLLFVVRGGSERGTGWDRCGVQWTRKPRGMEVEKEGLEDEEKGREEAEAEIHSGL